MRADPLFFWNRRKPCSGQSRDDTFQTCHHSWEPFLKMNKRKGKGCFLQIEKIYFKQSSSSPPREPCRVWPCSSHHFIWKIQNGKWKLQALSHPTGKEEEESKKVIKGNQGRGKCIRGHEIGKILFQRFYTVRLQLQLVHVSSFFFLFFFFFK